MLAGVINEFDAAADVELLIDIVQVDLHRPFGDGHPLGNRPVAQPLGHEADDLALARAQGARSPLGDRLTGLRLQQPTPRPCAKTGLEPQPAGMHRAHSVDEQRRNAEAFLAQFPHSMTIALDDKGVAAQAFDLQGMPSSILVDRQGKVRFVHMGYTEKTLAQYRSEIGQLLAEQH